MKEKTAKYNTFIEADGTAVYLLALVALLGLQLVGGIIAAVGKASGVNLLGNSAFQYTLTALMQVCNIAVVALFYRKQNLRPVYSVYNRVRPVALILAPLAGAVCLFSFFGLANVFVEALARGGYPIELIEETSIPLNTGGDIFGAILVTVLLAPLGEELVYRGALLSGLRKGFPAWGAVLLSSAAFSLMHMSPLQTVYQFCLACACAAFVLLTGSPIVSMLMHATSNLIAVLMEVTPFGAAFNDFIASISGTAGTTAAWVIVSAVVGAGLLVLLGFAFKKLRVRQEEREDLPLTGVRANGGMLGKKTGKMYLVFGLAICLFVWIFTLVTYLNGFESTFIA